MERAKWVWMHTIGVVCSIASLLVGGLHNPAIGFSVAVAILIALNILSPPKVTDKKILRMIYGSIREGGVRRGIFITEMFTIAVIYLAFGSFAGGMRTAGLSNALLGGGLVISSIASEMEARAMRKAME